LNSPTATPRASECEVKGRSSKVGLRKTMRSASWIDGRLGLIVLRIRSAVPDAGAFFGIIELLANPGRQD
jgi:hypothetical protein